MQITKKWWKESVVYQVYPRSFKDSNGDGVGDLNGILEKLDYLQRLGIDVIWLCPMFKSPQDDNGYDISDYQDIHTEFGSMADFDRLLKEMHKRRMKLVLDLVVNHTSDEHPWFIESRSSKSNPKRDWYIWQDGKNGQEPNNWESIFAGSAWEYDETTKQYYMHLFSRKQPDLNWENLEMREAIYKMVRWWMDKGIDGFRIDAISHARKEPGLADMPNPHGLKYVDSTPKHRNVPGILDYITELSKNTFNKYDVMTVGEANGVSAEEASEWVAEDRLRLNMLIQFEHVGLWEEKKNDVLDIVKMKSIFTRWQRQLHGVGWNALFVENHDVPRIINQWGDPKNYWHDSATCIATMYFFMQGTPFIYQGQEIGMTNTVFKGREDFDDVRARNQFEIRRAEGFTDEQITAQLADVSRDNARTPMQWNSSPQGGFTTGKPWLKVNPNFPHINVEQQLEDPGSIFNFYRRMIQLRKEHAVFVYGTYELVMPEHSQIYAYVRNLNGEKVLVICNMTARPAEGVVHEVSLSGAQTLLTNKTPRTWSDSGVNLEPFEAHVLRLL
ncbi:glucohydrolase [Bdellovibrio bacteriovorus]|uniref:Glucohydrolase n=1 Tax=Bdellovibrio bacteriovorus TaxID=959 RepID=A0A150WSP7_BDEBC|nr:alpha-glucosidase [Bdellovibrio bacteriovorus]KYG67426.1 glucohydrolase [Bdellovibrio bacteriovorus]